MTRLISMIKKNKINIISVAMFNNKTKKTKNPKKKLLTINIYLFTQQNVKNKKGTPY